MSHFTPIPMTLEFEFYGDFNEVAQEAVEAQVRDAAQALGMLYQLESHFTDFVDATTFASHSRELISTRTRARYLLRPPGPGDYWTDEHDHK